MIPHKLCPEELAAIRLEPPALAGLLLSCHLHVDVVVVIVTMEEPENSGGNDIAIVVQVSCLGRPLGRFPVLALYGALLNSHLHLALDHLLVKGEVGLHGEHAARDVDALDVGVGAAAPDGDLGVLGQQAVGARVRRRRHHVVLVHLVQVHNRVIRLKETLAHGGQVDL